MKRLITLLIALALFTSSQASHLAGAEIWYEHDTLNTYKIHLRLYSFCGGINLGSTAIVQASSATLTTNLSVSVDTTGSNIPNNGSSIYSCYPNTCNSLLSPIAGLQLFHYVGTVNLPNAAADWTFSYSNCCRNATSTFTSMPGTYVQTTLNNLVTPFNNGLSVPNSLPFYYPLNLNSNVSYAVTETDGDSISYALTSAMSNGTTPCVYASPYTPTNPLAASTLTLNAQTGMLSITPTQSGSFVLAIETREYRNGQLIGSSTRDHQILVLSSGPANAIPILWGVNGTTATTASVNVCGSSTMNFTINSSDPDLADSTQILSIAAPNGATFTTNNAQNQTVTFSWTPTLADVRSQPYLLILEVRDNNCGMRQKVYQLYVNHCNTDSVWAGDANADFTCDNYDILNIGIANGVTGAVRVGATSNWQAEWCANWANNFVNNINNKHADCNGDGTVNSLDLAAVAANYGQVHSKTNQIGQYKTLGLPDLYCDVSNVQARKGGTVSVPVMLGSSNSLMNDFYGISATVELLNAQTSAPISISKNVSWIGNATNSFAFEKNLAPTKSAFTFVRNDQTNVTAQQGQIGEISFPIDMASTIGTKVIVQFSDIKMIKNSGEEIQDYNVLQDTLTILSPTAVNDFDKGYALTVYPNPTKSNMTISLIMEKTEDCQIVLRDIVGKIVDANVYNGTLNAGKNLLPLNLNDKAKGEYLLEIQTELGKTILPVQKW